VPLQEQRASNQRRKKGKEKTPEKRKGKSPMFPPLPSPDADIQHLSSVTRWRRSATSPFLLCAAGGGWGSAWPASTACCHGSEWAVADPGAALQGRRVAAADS